MLSGDKGDYSFNRRGGDSFNSFNGTNDRGDRDSRSGGSGFRNNFRDGRDSRGDGRDSRDSRGDGRNGAGQRNNWNDRNRSSQQPLAPRNTRWQEDTRQRENDWLVPLARDERLEEELFGTGNTGINFNKYEDIPVEATGDNVPSHISSVYLDFDLIISYIIKFVLFSGFPSFNFIFSRLIQYFQVI